MDDLLICSCGHVPSIVFYPRPRLWVISCLNCGLDEEGTNHNKVKQNWKERFALVPKTNIGS